MEARTIYTIDQARLDKAEIDILHYVGSWFPTFDRWSVTELAHKCDLFADDATAAVDMLILHGLMENTDMDALMGRVVHVPPAAQEWIVENGEQISSLQLMNDINHFDDSETASA